MLLLSHLINRVYWDLNSVIFIITKKNKKNEPKKKTFQLKVEVLFSHNAGRAELYLAS